MNFLEYYHKKVGVKGAAKKKMAASALSPESTEKKTASQTTTEVEKSENNPQTAVATTQKEPESKVEAAAAKDDTTGIKKAAAVAKKEEAKETESPAPHKRAKKEEVELPPINRYTIVADDECVVWQWSFDQMEAMMKRSTDFRAALTRAITASIVSKVVNFTVSKTSALPTWSTWLDDWKYNAGASVNVKTDEDEDSEEELDDLDHYPPDAGGIDEHGEF